MCCGFVSLSNSWNVLDIWNILNCCETFPRYRISNNIVWISWINAIYFKKHYCCLFENSWVLWNWGILVFIVFMNPLQYPRWNTSNIMNIWDKIWKMVKPLQGVLVNNWYILKRDTFQEITKPLQGVLVSNKSRNE